ncbi:MAG: DUF2752 domain-containing protein [Muribaculaceae bacterium]
MTIKRTIFWLAIVLAALCFVAIYFLFDPSQCDLFPKCPFLMLTGLKCPGCGSQRAIHALLGGNIAEAWRHNAILVVSVPIVALYAICELKRLRLNALYRKINSPLAIWIVFAVVILWWIFRNIFGW